MKTFFWICLAAGCATTASAQVVTDRNSQLSCTYVYGYGSDTHFGQDSRSGTSLIASDDLGLTVNGGTQGVTGSGDLYSGGVGANFANHYDVTGPLNNFTRIDLWAVTHCEAPIFGPATAQMSCTGPGNLVELTFSVTSRPQNFHFFGHFASPGYPGAGEAKLSRQSGASWVTLVTTATLPLTQGDVDLDGTLMPGTYRTTGRVSMVATDNEFWNGEAVSNFEFTPNQVTISGDCSLSDFVGDLAAETVDCEIRDSVGNLLDTIPDVPLDLDGHYSFTTAISGSGLKLSARGRTWLKKTDSDIVCSAGQTTTADFILANGDADGSGEVDAADIDYVIAHFGEIAGGSFNPNADLDGSLEVDAADIDVAIANFGALDD